MAAKISAQMLHALELIKAGRTAYAAAKMAGVTQGAISRSRIVREWKEQQNAKPPQPAA